MALIIVVTRASVVVIVVCEKKLVLKRTINATKIDNVNNVGVNFL